MQETDTEIDNEQAFGTDPASLEVSSLDASLAAAKARFAKTDFTAAPPLAPTVSENARESQQLRAQLFDAERLALRAQKAASEYREQLTEAQADIANMKSRWYAAEKARNAVSSQREVDSSSLNTLTIRLQKELERTQQLASSDMERANVRIRSLEEKLEKALRNAAIAETSQNQYRKRSKLSLTVGVSVAVILAGSLIYEKMPHRAAGETASLPSTADSSAVQVTTRRNFAGRVAPAIPLEALSQRPFVPKAPVRSLPDALGRLNQALRALPGLEAEDVIKQIRKRQSTPGKPTCQFDWKDGGPSMIFEQSAKGESMEKWAMAISRCADAVEQSH